MGKALKPSTRSYPGKLRVVIIATHPIQYHIPWFRALEETGIYDLTILYGMLPDSLQQGIGFGVTFTWDIPMLEGYSWKKLDNVSKSPDLGSYSGCDTPGIFNELKSINPDLVILTGWQSKMLVQAGRAARKLKLPVIMRGESNALRPRPWVKRIFHRLYLRRFDAFLTIGKSNKQFYLNNGMDINLLFDTPYFIDNDRFLACYKEEATQSEQQRHALGIDPNAFCFIYAGKLEEKKNVTTLLEGFTKLYQIRKDIHFLIIGDGERRPELESIIERHNLPVSLAGFVNQSEIPLMYAAGNCFLLGSDYGETWGLVVNEAMVCGLPAIVSNRVGCGPDLIIPGKTGYIFPFGDSHRLAQLMLEMVEDPEAAANMGMAAKGRVLQQYSVENTVRGTGEAISALIKHSH